MAEELSITEYAVLGLLTFGERSGYELDALAKQTIGFFWRPAKSKIYVVLPRLVDRGLASASTIAQEKRPDKTVYRITPRGKHELRAWLASPDVIVAPGRHGLLLKLFFGAHAEPGALIALVERHKRRAEEQLIVLERIEAEIDPEGREEDFFPYLTLLHGLEDARSTIIWAEDVLRLLARHRARARRVRP
jgi:PadR family transcriptional regulator, regulatory protein AphA